MSPAIARPYTDSVSNIKWPTAVVPAPGASVKPCEAFRAERYFNRQTGVSVPALVAGVDRSRLFEVFLALLEPLGSVVDVFLESNHLGGISAGRILRREGIDAPVLASMLCEFEDFLLDDGSTAITVAATRSPIEVQLDEHKHLIIYAWERKSFARIFRSFGIHRHDDLTLLSDVPHVHNTAPGHAGQFHQLAESLGTSDYRRVVTG